LTLVLPGDTYVLNPYLNDLFFLQSDKNPLKNPCFAHLFAFLYIEFYGSAEITGEAGGSSTSLVAVFLRQTPPFATVFAPLQNRVQKQQVFVFNVAALNRQQAGYFSKISFR
jgi:hypothetical protein